MAIALRDDIVYILLNKIHQGDGNGKHSVDFQVAGFLPGKIKDMWESA